jgi:hypothetical protein
MKKSYLLFLFLLAFSLPSFSQVSVKDSVFAIQMIQGNYSLHFPGGHLKDRFGASSMIGPSFMNKTKSNYLFGFHFNFLFGSKIREEGILDGISTASGNIIDKNGQFTEVRLYQRGFSTGVTFGKLFPVLSPNKNSGFIVTGGVGLLQHKIRIENPGNTAPQILGDYTKGYDRLSNGLSVSGFAGYLFLSNSRLLNFYGGFEHIRAFTQNRRDLNFDTMEKDETKRLDLLSGFRVGWIIPLYKKMPQKYYYY